MKACYANNVVRSSTADCGGGRTGTALCTKARMRALLGSPTYEGSIDEKVTIGWVFNTPRGRAEVRDYWWNDTDEWSIASANDRASRWLAGYLRLLGIPCRHGPTTKRNFIR